jgi:RNA polymerase sigma-70 factor (ECF subfamily)
MNSIARRYCSDLNEIDNLINQGFLKVLNALPKYREQQRFAAWISRVLVNHILDEFRKKEKNIWNIHLDDDDYNDNFYCLSEAEQKWEEEELNEMLYQLPNVNRTVFNFFVLDGYSHKEISKKLNISVGTSKWHVNEARRRLKEMLEKSLDVEKKRIMTYEN